VFTAMGGINVAVVPLLQLVGVVPVVLDACRREAVRWRHALLTTGKALLLSGLLACYWLVPALAAVRAGEAVAETTESLEVIGAPASFAEVLRGLGFWPLYGSANDGPFLPGYTSYLTSVPVILLSFGLPLLAALGALLSRSGGRLLAVLLVTVGAVTMVGLHPVESPTPYGRALRWAFETVPGLVALRTTNKAGGVLLLGLALLVGLGAAAVAGRVRAPSRRALVLLPVTAVVAAGVAPALAGDLYPVRMPVPDYWRQAAADLDARGSGRVLMVPGVARASYRWGYSGPDDLGNSLLARSSAVRTTVPNGSPYAANLLAGVDLALQDRALAPQALSTVADYVGAGDLLVRHDLVWEAAAGARPSDVAAALAADPGLRPAAAYGRRGEYTGGPDRNDAERELPPLQRYTVEGATGPVRAASAPLVVDGDPATMPDLVRAGLLTQRPAVLLAGALDDAGLRTALDAGGRIVLTDGNRRREWASQRLAGGVGPLLPADADPAPTRALFGAAEQTVLDVSGPATVSVTGRGLVFGPVPYGRAVAAFDGDRSTAWLAGNFGTGVGNAVTLRLARPGQVGQIVLHPYRGGQQRITTVRVRAGEVSRSVTLPVVAPSEGIAVPLGAFAETVTVEITGVDGYGINPVGFTEIEVPGVRLIPAARLPTAFVDRLAGASGETRERVAQAPLDVVMTRLTSDPSTASDDEEARLDRDFALPDARTFRVAGTLRAAVTSSDADLDALAGQRGAVVTATSSRAFDFPALRGSYALDVRADGAPELGTAWVPADPVVGEWLDVRFPRRDVSTVTITQAGGGGGPADIGYADRAELVFDDGSRYVAPLQPTVTEVPVRARGARSVRITLLSRVGGAPVRIADVDIAGARTRPGAVSAQPPARCLLVGTIDGRPLRVRVTGSAAALSGGQPVPVTTCGDQPLRLGPGRHALRGNGSWVLDALHLGDAGARAPATPRPPTVVVTERGGPTTVAQVGAAEGPYYLVAGEGFDARWRARLDGQDLGPPIVVDGYSVGWRVEDGRPHRLVVEYAPQRAARVAYIAFLGIFAVCVVMLLLPGRPARQTGPPGRVRTALHRRLSVARRVAHRGRHPAPHPVPHRMAHRRWPARRFYPFRRRT
jgi:arabinofuranan 3-O-arabinosyltransferase